MDDADDLIELTEDIADVVETMNEHIDCAVSCETSADRRANLVEAKRSALEIVDLLVKHGF